MVGHFDNSDMLQFFWKTFASIFGKKTWTPDAYLKNVKDMYQEVLVSNKNKIYQLSCKLLIVFYIFLIKNVFFNLCYR